MLRSRPPYRASAGARAALGLAAALTLVALGHRAHAVPPTRPPDWQWHRRDQRVVAGLELKYTLSPAAVARACEDEEWFRTRIATLLGGMDPFKPATPSYAPMAIPFKRLEVSIVLRWPALARRRSAAWSEKTPPEATARGDGAALSAEAERSSRDFEAFLVERRIHYGNEHRFGDGSSGSAGGETGGQSRRKVH